MYVLLYASMYIGKYVITYTHVGFIRITVKFQLVDPYFFPKKGIVLILILSAMW